MERLESILTKTNMRLDVAQQSPSYKKQLQYIAGKKVTKLDELLLQEFPDNSWLIERLIPLNGTTVLSAQPASYKTWLLLDMAISVATGKMFLNHFETVQTGALIIDEENGEALLQQWVSKLGVINEAPIYFMSNKGFLLEEHQVKETIQFCKEHQVTFLTLDSLVRIHTGDENDAKQMAKVFRSLRMFNNAGITVLLIHHNRKPGKVLSLGSQEMRGSSDILAAVDCHLALLRDEHRVTLKQNKVRLAEELHPIDLVVEVSDDTFRFKYLGTSEPELSKRTKARAAIIELLNEYGSLNQKQLSELLSKTPARLSITTLRSILTSMLSEGQLDKAPGAKNETLYTINHPDLKS